MYRRSGRFGKYQNKSKLGKDPLKFFSLFNPHTLPAPFHNSSKGKWIQIGSMDPAIYFFGLRCERIYEDGTTEAIAFSLTDFTKPGKLQIPEVGKENFYYINTIEILKRYCDEFLKDCHYICIESQLSFAYDMVRMSSHIIAVMCCFLKDQGNRPIIVEMDPKLKSRLLGAPPMSKINTTGKKMSSSAQKLALKKWCAARAREELEAEGDTESIDFMNEMKASQKEYDLGDVKCQIIVMKLLIKASSLPKIRSKNQIVIVMKKEEVKTSSIHDTKIKKNKVDEELKTSKAKEKNSKKTPIDNGNKEVKKSKIKVKITQIDNSIEEVKKSKKKDSSEEVKKSKKKDSSEEVKKSKKKTITIKKK
jgi:hypothetical protein